MSSKTEQRQVTLVRAEKVHEPLAAIAFTVLVLALICTHTANAQQAPLDGATARAAAPVKMAMPSTKAQTLLVRTAILTLNDAIETGNFTVLRDKGSPAFQTKFSAAHLSLIFHDLVRDRADLSSIAVISIKLADKPSIDGNNRLNIKGSFQTLKGPYQFDLLFEPVLGKWRVTGISVSAQKKVARSNSAQPAAQPAPTKKKRKRKK